MTYYRSFTHFWVSVITGWALVGGMLLLLIVGLNIASIIGSIFLAPIPGDFELTQVGIAVAVFCFLPYCQLFRHNVTADVFTAKANKKIIMFLRIASSIIALLFATLLVWRMGDGMLDQKAYNYTTTILQFPIWVAFVPILISLCFLIIASLLTIGDDFNLTPISTPLANEQALKDGK
ncbi:MAG: TRAP transporter small permease [Alphaproteobacteria bacterium]|jgi:TRAP-type C4-dicarboxylate transport system permease small subunit|nr:TRAP transporter small permease [Alphaproteobacteria bacterium]